MHKGPGAAGQRNIRAHFCVYDQAAAALIYFGLLMKEVDGGNNHLKGDDVFVTKQKCIVGKFKPPA